MSRARAHVTLIAAVLLVASGLAAERAIAEPHYPSQTITLIVPFSAGGPTDVLARILAQHMSRTLGQSIVVENVSGAGGTIGTTRVAKAAADGYTIVMGNLGTHVASIAMYKSLAYDPRTDFEPVMLVGSTPMVLLVKNDLPVATLAELVAYARARPTRLSVGSAGVGSIAHLTLLLFSHLTKVEFQHVPYRGLSQAENDLLGGQIEMLFDQTVSATPHVVAGTVKPIAVTALRRSPSLPGVPTSVEAGLAELQTIAWTALFVPRHTPTDIISRLNAAADQAMHDDAIARRMADLGSDLPPPDQRTPDALAQLLHSEIDKWVPLIRAAGLSEN